jgi:hypothetical protein
MEHLTTGHEKDCGQGLIVWPTDKQSFQFPRQIDCSDGKLTGLLGKVIPKALRERLA